MRKAARILITASIVLGLAGIGFAQERDGEGANTHTETATMDPADQLNVAQEVVAGGERLSGRIASMMNEAQRDKDIIRVNCLDDKLTRVNANLRTARTRLNMLEAQSDPQLRSQAITVLLVLGQKFQVLDQEASQCLGQHLFETGATRLEQEIESSMLNALQAVDPQVVPPLTGELAPDLSGNQTPPIVTEVSPSS